MQSAQGNVRRQPLATCALLLGACLFALALGETTARWLLRPGRGKEGAEGQHYTEYDPLLGWRKVPGSRTLYVRREYRTEVVINSQGLRDRERAYAPARASAECLLWATRSSRATPCPWRRPSARCSRPGSRSLAGRSKS